MDTQEALNKLRVYVDNRQADVQRDIEIIEVLTVAIHQLQGILDTPSEDVRLLQDKLLKKEEEIVALKTTTKDVK